MSGVKRDECPRCKKRGMVQWRKSKWVSSESRYCCYCNHAQTRRTKKRRKK